MKKILLIITVLVSSIFILDNVKANTFDKSYSDVVEYYCDFFVTDYDYLKSLGFDDEVQEVYRLLIEEYNANYSETYPYYYFDLVVLDSLNCNFISSFNSVGYIYLFLNLYTSVPSLGLYDIPNGEVILKSSYIVNTSTYVLPSVVGNYSYLDLLRSSPTVYNSLAYFISNFDLVNNSNNVYNITGNKNFTIYQGDIINPIFNAENAFITNYKEINLNDYAYVALSLKDYSLDSFNSTIYVKGQLCPTAVYNRGLTARDDILGSITDRCNIAYNDFVPVRFSVTSSDLKNKAIYYVKAYDISIDNIIKVDTSVFDISYISEEDKDNPIIIVEGNKISSIPYDKLPSTATKNEEENFAPGASEKFEFSDIFTAPLDFLIEIWGTIVTFFSLITSFISLLPPILQNFLYASFMLAIALGLIKIIL